MLLMLAHFNDALARPLWFRDILDENLSHTLGRPNRWGEKRPLVSIHAFCLHANHFHLLLEEIAEGGVSAFMQKLGNGLAGYVNEKYGEFGSPFQGSYRSKTIDSDAYLRYVIAYIQTKNVFERFPGGYATAQGDFPRAFAWTLSYAFSSAHDFWGRSDLPARDIVSEELVPKLWDSNEYERFARDVIEGRVHIGTQDKNAFHGAFA